MITMTILVWRDMHEKLPDPKDPPVIVRAWSDAYKMKYIYDLAKITRTPSGGWFWKNIHSDSELVWEPLEWAEFPREGEKEGTEKKDSKTPVLFDTLTPKFGDFFLSPTQYRIYKVRRIDLHNQTISGGPFGGGSVREFLPKEIDCYWQKIVLYEASQK